MKGSHFEKFENRKINVNSGPQRIFHQKKFPLLGLGDRGGCRSYMQKKYCNVSIFLYIFILYSVIYYVSF